MKGIPAAMQKAWSKEVYFNADTKQSSGLNYRHSIVTVFFKISASKVKHQMKLDVQYIGWGHVITFEVFLEQKEMTQHIALLQDTPLLYA